MKNSSGFVVIITCKKNPSLSFLNYYAQGLAKTCGLIFRLLLLIKNLWRRTPFRKPSRCVLKAYFAVIYYGCCSEEVEAQSRARAPIVI